MSNKLVQLLNQYGHEHTILETGKTIQIRPITTGMMKSVLQYEGVDDPSIIETVLDDIIKGCVVTNNFDVDNLTLQDRFELLIGIRKISKGSTYNFTIKCPKCKSESIQAIDLDGLGVTPYPESIERDVVINDNLTISFDYVRRGQQKKASEMVESIEGLTDNQKMVEIATYMYAFGIVGCKTKQGELADISIKDKAEFLDNLPEDSYEKINGWYEKNNYGTTFKYTIECKAGSCEFDKEEDIPITGFFF